MKTNNSNRKSKFLAFLLSVMLVASTGAMFASCADTSSDSSSSSSTSEETEETKKDSGEIKNANFDFTTVSDTTVIGTSVTGWSRSVYSTASGSANSSKSASGVIDTSEKKWDYLITSNYTKAELEEMSDAQAEENWAKFTVKDKLTYYDVWKAREANKEKSISTDFAAYESINVDEEDIPTVSNPGKAPGAEDDNVLMIHNNYYPKTDKYVGTAQKYTSSSTVTIPAGETRKVSVWVKTADLKSAASDGTVQDAVGKGAYINITHSVGGKSLDAYEVKNINTEEKWVEYSFYLKGSYYAETTFSVVLGLGQGSTTDRLDYVNGYAFFDNITLSEVTEEDFDKAVAALPAGWHIATLESEKYQKTVDAFKESNKTFVMDFYNDAWTPVDMPNVIWVDDTKSSDGSSVNPEKADTDVAGVLTKGQMKTAVESNIPEAEYLGYVYNGFFTEDKFVGDNDKMLMLLSTNGTAYTAERKDEDPNSEKAMKFTLEDDWKYMAISFYVKTSDLNGGVGAGVTLVDDVNKTAFTAIDTSDLAEDDENTTSGWQQVFFFVERGEEATGDMDFYLSFSYGPTDITSSATTSSFAQGFAAFTNFTVYNNMSLLEYEAAATGTYAKKVTLVGAQDEEAEGNSGFDAPVSVPSNALEEGLANPQNYKGVYSDNYRVKAPTTAADFVDADKKREYNSYQGAGLLNRENFKEYFGENTDAWLDTLKTMATEENADYDKAEEVWAYHFGDATQPLVIMNEQNATKSYGFIGTAKSTSEEYTAVSLRVKAENANAYVYLIDMDDETRQSTLSVSRSLTYWYDKDGNVCTSDTSKKTTVAFKLQKNGLYKASKNWEGYEKLGAVKDEYFANLSAYIPSADGSVLYASENSANHDYYDYTWNREVFFKGEDSNYYAKTENGSMVKVVDLATIPQDVLAPRYTAEKAQDLMAIVEDTDGEWAYVTFYIRQGATAKNYRLEVWNGPRNGAPENTTDANYKKGYVAFDVNNPGTASDNFALYEEYEDLEGVVKFDGVFSYFDTANHVRYDATLDTNKVGNAYEDYDATSYEASIAFLAYQDGKNYTFFADYSVSDQTVAAKVETDDSTTEDSSEEEETDNELNIWLLASSIAVAGVLVLAVASIIVRKVIENYKKKHGAKARKTVKEKKPAAKKVEKTVDEDSPYND